MRWESASICNTGDAVMTLFGSGFDPLPANNTMWVENQNGQQFSFPVGQVSIGGGGVDDIAVSAGVVPNAAWTGFVPAVGTVWIETPGGTSNRLFITLSR